MDKVINYKPSWNTVKELNYRKRKKQKHSKSGNRSKLKNIIVS